MSNRKSRARCAIKKAMPNRKAIYHSAIIRDKLLRAWVYGLLGRPVPPSIPLDLIRDDLYNPGLSEFEKS